MRICFITTYIGPKNLLDISNNFPKSNNYDYLCFTNLNKNEINNKSWEIIQINLQDFNTTKNNIKISRYFKFYVIDYLVKINRKYNYIFYCDSYLYPNIDINWQTICNQIKNSNFKIIQYLHPTKKISINIDFGKIIGNKKETIDNIEKTKLFLKNMDLNIDLDTKLYYENTVFGYDPNDKDVINFMKEFWNYYQECPTYRDQPLWNFLYLKNNKSPYVDKLFRKKFLGKKKIERKLKEYQSSNLI